MKKFIIKLSLICAITISISIGLVLFVNKKISNKKIFSITNCPENIIVGHSHMEEAFNDSLIKNTKNLATSGENIYYTYFKVQELLKCNKNIKSIFISFTNHQILKNYDETSLWDDSHINKFFSKYNAFMSQEDYLLLLKKNPYGTIKAQPLATKKYSLFLLKNRENIYTDYLIGGYKGLESTKMDSILKNKKPVQKFDNVAFKYPEQTIKYLDKIISLCNFKKVKIYLTRTPVHNTWNELNNEYYFTKILKAKYSKIDFLDFKNYPIDKSEYYDQSHLNKKGAQKFSVFFNYLLINGLLQKNNKQEYINQQIINLNSN